jgi:hypothetical protein
LRFPNAGFGNRVDQLAQAYLRDVLGSLDSMKSAVKKRAELLQKQICTLKAPPGVPEKDINLIVFQTLSAETEDIKKAIDVQMKFRVDSKAGTLKPNGLGLGGSIMDL